MTDINKLKQVANKMIFPVRISGTMNLLAFPSPDEVKLPEQYPAKQSRTEVLANLSYTSNALHTTTITQYGKPTNLQVLPGQISVPETCVICNKPAVDQGVIEAPGKVKLTYGKTTISGSNAKRVWDAIQRDRYWFTMPVCKDHQNDFHKKVYLNAEKPGGNLELKLPNKDWSKQFIEMNEVKHAVYKNGEYLRKFRWTMLMLYLGFLGTGMAIALTITIGAWAWLLPTVPLLVGGLYLLLNNRYEVLVSDIPAEIDGKKNKLKWLEGIISLDSFINGILGTGVVVVVIGLFILFMKVNGEYLAWPWYIKGGITAIGLIIIFLGIGLNSSIKKK